MGQRFDNRRKKLEALFSIILFIKNKLFDFYPVVIINLRSQ